ncbi:ABC transporter substrate-binding protein [Mesorhizobium sp. M0700]|uniref:ABC transporter substrate-binding protein n=1 Tax=Mesorhizobium sp. M0700 TaxID=2956988 RepID=UPI00333D2ACF
MAVKLAIDRDEIVDKVLPGYGSVGDDMPVNASYPLFDPSIPQRRYDPEQATAYKKESGHDGTPIVLLTADGAFLGAVAPRKALPCSASAAAWASKR